jgi:hypothetical protein
MRHKYTNLIEPIGFIHFKDILIQYGIEPTVKNNRIYGNLKNSGLVKTKKVSSRIVLYDAQSVKALFDFIAYQKSFEISSCQSTSRDIVRHLDPTCPWDHTEIGGLCAMGLLNYEAIRDKDTNSKHPRKYICEESYNRLRAFYGDNNV